ncbi:hypothetical protein ACLB2K_019243 [Fragaria x ananassa]
MTVAVGTTPTEAQLKLIEEQKLKDLKVKNFLYQTIDREILDTIMNTDISKQTWDSLQQKFQGSTRVKRAQLQALRTEYEILHMKEGETINGFFGRTLAIANKMKACGENISESTITEKILRSMVPKFAYVLCSIEESNNLETMTINELQSSLLVHEQRMKGHNEEEHALKVSTGRRFGAREDERHGGRGKARGGSGGRGRLNKGIIECYKCHASFRSTTTH